jgi:hypothetical protein
VRWHAVRGRYGAPAEARRAARPGAAAPAAAGAAAWGRGARPHTTRYVGPRATFVDAPAADRRRLRARRDRPSPRWRVGMTTPPVRFLSVLDQDASYAV